MKLKKSKKKISKRLKKFLGVGSNAIPISKLMNVAYFIQIDRKGNKDIVNSIYGSPICSKEFSDKVLKIGKKFGYNLAEGMFTDVEILSSKTNISSINLSCGYYNPHTVKEYVNLSDLKRCISLVEEIILNISGQHLFEYAEFNP